MSPMLNHKQQELAEHILQSIKQRFPETEFTEARISPADKESIWLYVVAPNDEDRETELRHYAAELTSDVFQESGFLFTVKPRVLVNG